MYSDSKVLSVNILIICFLREEQSGQGAIRCPIGMVYYSGEEKENTDDFLIYKSPGSTYFSAGKPYRTLPVQCCTMDKRKKIFINPYKSLGYK